MKLTIVLITLACLQVSARVNAQRITFSQKNTSLTRVLEVIKKQSGYTLFYDNKALGKPGSINIDLHNASVEEALQLALKDFPLSFVISGQTIVIKKKEKNLLNEISDFFVPQAEIKGKITDEGGKPLPGVVVRLKGTNKGTNTNANGEFVLTVPDNQAVILVSLIGYEKQEIKLGAKTTLNITMKVSITNLDEMVVKGYYSTSQRLNTSSQTRISAEEIAKQPVTNVLQALQGRVTGLNIKQTSGYGTAPLSVQIRGQNSIAYASDPLYVIDGVPMMAGSGDVRNSGLNQNFMVGSGIGQSPIYSINPMDIESIDVLKDADATAIYGSQGANGVILITTKKGKAGNTKIDFNMYSGAGKVTRLPKLLNTEQYLAMRREAYANDNITPTLNLAPDLLKWDQNRYTDWQKVLVGNTAHQTDAQVAISGGDDLTTYRFAGGYHKQNDVTTASGSDKRTSFSMSLNTMSRNKKFRASFQGSYSIATVNMINLDNSLIILPPNAPSIYDNAGNLNFKEWGSYYTGFIFGGNVSNPFGVLLKPYDSSTDNLQSNLLLQYRVIKDLNLKVSGGYSTIQNNETFQNPKIAQDPANNPTSDTRFGRNSVKTWIVEPQAEYNKGFGGGQLSALIGGTFQSTVTTAGNLTASGFSNEALLRTMAAAKTITVYSDDYTPYKYQAIFGRLNYTWKNKYIINATGRRDGSSRFGPGKQNGNFGAIGAAWIVSDEPFFKNNIQFISFAKLRSSYGVTGSANIGDYKYLSQWKGGTYSYQGTATLAPTGHYDPDYQWEQNRKLELALELGMLQDRIQFTASWYRNRSGNQLVNTPLPNYTGFTLVTTNLPAVVQNKGLEFTISSSNIRTRDFSWNTSFNISRSRNKLISFPGLQTSSYFGTYEVGQPLTIARLLHFTGINPQTGQYTFQDQNGDGKILSAGVASDLVNTYDKAPAFFGGLNNSITYKNFDFSFMFQFTKQKGFRNKFSLANPGSINNQTVNMIEHWQKPGDISENPKLTSIYSTDYINYTSTSDAGLVDASFARLQNVSLSYHIPAKLAKKALMQNARIYVQCQNLLTITNYQGADPDTQSATAIPPLKYITAGLQVTF